MRRTLFFFLPLLFLFLSCAAPPDEELAGAKQAVEAARSQEADVYVKETFDEAQKALTSAENEIKAQQEKSFFSQDYSDALRLLGVAKTKAEEAAAQVPEAKEAARQRAETLREQASAALESAQARLKKAPRSKGSALDLEALQGDLAGAERSMQQGVQALENSRFLEAASQFEKARRAARSVESEIP